MRPQHSAGKNAIFHSFTVFLAFSSFRRPPVSPFQLKEQKILRNFLRSRNCGPDYHNGNIDPSESGHEKDCSSPQSFVHLFGLYDLHFFWSILAPLPCTARIHLSPCTCTHACTFTFTNFSLLLSLCNSLAKIRKATLKTQEEWVKEKQVTNCVTRNINNL